MKWVTWENVGVDRMACAWLIRRFLDPQAEFVFVPAGTKPLPEGAEPFDLPGVCLSHRRGHCTFHTMLREYDLKDPVLHRIAGIVDEADTVQEVALEPAAPGLDLLCRGMRLTSPDDTVALERGALLFEALYAQIAAEAIQPQARKILFLCPHNAAKSVLAAAYCQRLAAQRGLHLVISTAGTDPSDLVDAAVAELLGSEGIDVTMHRPRRVTPEDLANAFRVVSLGCELGDLVPSGVQVDRWDDVPSVKKDLLLARNAIVARVEQLVAELAAR